MHPIMVDYDKIWEAVYNIIDNAIKYSKPESAVKISASATKEILTVSISDSGDGIPDEYKERIFERFYRIDKSRSKDSEGDRTTGTGLGLSIVKHGAKYHNAKVSVKSKVGEGSEFCLMLPVM